MVTIKSGSSRLGESPIGTCRYRRDHGTRFLDGIVLQNGQAARVRRVIVAAARALVTGCTGHDSRVQNPASTTSGPLRGGVVIVEAAADHSGYVVAFQECVKPGAAS